MFKPDLYNELNLIISNASHKCSSNIILQLYLVRGVNFEAAVSLLHSHHLRPIRCRSIEFMSCAPNQHLSIKEILHELPLVISKFQRPAYDICLPANNFKLWETDVFTSIKTVTMHFFIVLQIFHCMRVSNKNKGWSEDEDRLITELVEKHGTKNWAKIAEDLHLEYGCRKKSGKQCRERWHNHLDPGIVKKAWSAQEEDTLFQEHRRHGNKWTVIAEKLPGRTDNSIKNHFYSTVRKSLRRISKFMGSKDSTVKMRKIKPSTLSKIFSLATEGKVSEGAYNADRDAASSANQVNCQEIAHYLMDFSRTKLSDKKYKVTQDDMKKFEKILQEMGKINDIYQSEKMAEAKLKKEKYLEKNFDNAASSQSSQDDSLEEQDENQLTDEHAKPSASTKAEIIVTRSSRKVRLPQAYHSTSNPSKKQLNRTEKEEKATTGQHQSVTMRIMQSPTRKVSEYNYQPELNPYHKENDFDFDVQIDRDNEQQNMLLMKDLLHNSPAGFHTSLFSLTPKRNLTPRGSCQFHNEITASQPFKNEDCDLMLQHMVSNIRANLNAETRTRGVALQSPSSAFRQWHPYQ